MKRKDYIRVGFSGKFGVTNIFGNCKAKGRIDGENTRLENKTIRD